MIKTIGSSKENDLVIDKGDISGQHARITLLENNNFLVEDRAVFGEKPSTNGTYINGNQVNKATITINDEVRLSIAEKIDLEKLFELRVQKPRFHKTDSRDFSNEFFLLKQVYEDYRKERRNIVIRHQRKASIIRAAIMISPLFIYQLLEKLNFLKTYQLPVSVLASSAAMYVTGVMSPLQALDELDDQFRVRYVCPNPTCHQALGNIPWQHYYNQKKCMRCDGKYTKDDVKKPI